MEGSDIPVNAASALVLWLVGTLLGTRPGTAVVVSGRYRTEELAKKRAPAIFRNGVLDVGSFETSCRDCMPK
jgi:hypothetical protein